MTRTNLPGILLTVAILASLILPFATLTPVLATNITFTASSSDAYFCEGSGWSAISSDMWDEVHDDVSASPTTSTNWLSVRILRDVSGSDYSYRIDRTVLYFDTSSLPDNANITSAILRLYFDGTLLTEISAWELQVQNGMPTYPHEPPVAGDYLYSHYSGSGGTLSSSEMGGSQEYKDITLNATGISWINPTGTTKFMLRDGTYDVPDSEPPGAEWEANWFRFYSYEAGVAYRPQLVVTYGAATVPTVTTNVATYVAATTARLNSYLSNDGGEACDVRFQYGIATGVYTNSTKWINDTYVTGDSPHADIASLTNTTQYFFRAQANNTEGLVSSNELSFTTGSSVEAPSNLTAYPSSTSISLSWTKGLNTTRTLIRGQIGSYPAGGEDIDAGMEATDRLGVTPYDYTIINKGNPTTGSGNITEIDVWANQNLTNLTVGMFYMINGTTLKCRSAELIGNVTAGSTQTFNVSLVAVMGDYLGSFAVKRIEMDVSGYQGIWTFDGDTCTVGNESTYSFVDGNAVSVYGRGEGIWSSAAMVVYNGTMSTTIHTGLTPGTSYFYRAWGVSGDDYTEGYTSVVATTSAGVVAPDDPDAPVPPAIWYGAPDHTRLSGVPFYDMVNDLANEYGMPPTNFWLLLMLFGATLMSLFFYRVSHSGTVAIIGGGVTLVILLASLGGLLWIVFAVGIIATGVFVQVRRA